MSIKKGSEKRVNKKKKGYNPGTVNEIKTNNNGKRHYRKKKQKNEYKSLVRKLCIAICLLIAVFVIHAFVKENFAFNGINYKKPSKNEVIEIVTDTGKNSPSEQVKLNLKGDLVVKMKVGQKYVEPGYSATSDLNGDITDYVKVTGHIDTSKAGTYKLTYTLDYRGIKPKLTRLVKVKGKKVSTSSKPSTSDKPSNSTSKEPSDNTNSNNEENSNTSLPPDSQNGSNSSPTSPVEMGNITLSLNGDATMYITQGSSFNDPGAKAVDDKGKNQSDKIQRAGAVDINVPGTYKITYSITNYNGEVLSVVRNVIVQQMGITLKSNPTTPTNKSVTITVIASVEQFSSIVLPNGERTTEKIYNYKVTKNGTYEFIVYNKNSESRKASMVVNNIDKEKPRGKCVITHQGNGSILTINATDNTGIASYVYSGKTYTTNVITFDKKIHSGLQINVGFYDLAGNFSNCNCLAP